MAFQVGSRYVNTIGGVGQVAFQKTFAKDTNASFNLGVEATRELGSRKVGINTLGVKTNAVHGGPTGYVDAIAGLSINRNVIKKGMNIFANLQGAKGITNSSKHNYKIALDAGIEVKF